jgi:hypothetical protein
LHASAKEKEAPIIDARKKIIVADLSCLRPGDKESTARDEALAGTKKAANLTNPLAKLSANCIFVH